MRLLIVALLAVMVVGCTNSPQPVKPPLSQSITGDIPFLVGKLPQAANRPSVSSTTNGIPSSDQAKEQVSYLLSGIAAAWGDYFKKNAIVGGDVAFVNIVAGQERQTPCGETVTADGQPIYCIQASQLFIPIETVRKLWTHPQQNSDIALAAALGHSFGHYVHDRLWVTMLLQPLHEYSKEYILFLDCLSGLWMQAGFGSLNGAEVDAAIRGLLALEDDTPATGQAPTQEERAAAFEHGRGVYELTRCFKYWPGIGS